MTLSEFKAWFEGFTESMDGPPSLKQWERIQARVKEISGAPVTERHYIDRYWPTVRPIWNGPYNGGLMPFGMGVCHNSAVLGVGQNAGQTVLNASSCDGKVGNIAFASDPKFTGAQSADISGWETMKAATAFNSHAAMTALGRADAATLRAA